MPLDGVGVRRIGRSWWLRTSTCGARPGVEQVCDLSVVLPCLDEAETLATCITKAQQAIKKLAVDGEVIVADNGSADGSQEIARRLGARVIDVPVKGYGSALLSGIAAARSEFVVMADADNSYDLSDLEPFVDALRRGAELVMGNRFLGGIEPGAMPTLNRYVGNPILTRLGRLLFRSPSGDFHCGMRAFRRSSILSLGLRTAGMEFASEMVVRATLAKLRIVEVPVTLSPDGRTRAPHLRPWRDGWRHLRFLFLYSPRWLFFYPGIALMLVGLALGIALLPGPLHIGSVGLDVNAFVYCAVAVIIGFQAVLFSVLAESVRGGRGPAAAQSEHGTDLPYRHARGRARRRRPPAPRRDRPLHLHRVVLERAVLRGAEHVVHHPARRAGRHAHDPGPRDGAGQLLPEHPRHQPALMTRPQPDSSGTAAPAVSAVVLAFRDEPWLERCVHALLASTGVDVDVVLVDNGCTDGAVERLAPTPGVVVVRPGENLGFAGGLRTRARRSRPASSWRSSTAISWSRPTRCSELVAFAAKPGIGIAQPSIRLSDDPSRLNSDGNEVHFLGYSWCGGFGKPASIRTAPRSITSVMGAAMVLRRELWDELGGFEDRYFAYHEDVELSRRCWYRGLELVNVPSAVVIHRYEFGREPSKIYLSERNRLLFVLTAYQSRTLLVLALPLIAVELAALAGSAVTGTARARRWPDGGGCSGTESGSRGAAGSCSRSESSRTPSWLHLFGPRLDAGNYPLPASLEPLDRVACRVLVGGAPVSDQILTGPSAVLAAASAAWGLPRGRARRPATTRRRRR